jgi:hypothetical protein
MIPTDLPVTVQRILAFWLPRAERGLQSRALSFSLFGGVALGDFAPRWSDVDVCVWLTGPRDDEETHGLDALGAETLERFVTHREGGWESGQAVEPLLLAVEQAAADEGGLSPFDRLVLSRHGVRIAGDPVPVAPPSRETLRRQLRTDLESLARPKLDRPIWLAGMIQWMARSLAFWRDGDVLGKTVALEREIEAGSQHSEAFRLALRMRCEEGSAACWDRHQEIREAYQAVAGPIGERLRELAG